MLHILRKHVNNGPETALDGNRRHSIVVKTDEDNEKTYFYKGFQIFKIENGYECGICRKPFVGNPHSKYFTENNAIMKHITYAHCTNSIRKCPFNFTVVHAI